MNLHFHFILCGLVIFSHYGQLELHSVYNITDDSYSDVDTDCALDLHISLYMPQRPLAAAENSFAVMMGNALMRVSDVIVNITAEMAQTNSIVVS